VNTFSHNYALNNVAVDADQFLSNGIDHQIHVFKGDCPEEDIFRSRNDYGALRWASI